MLDDESTDAAQGRSLSIWERRLPHILGIYLATSYTVFEMLQWIVKRFQLAAVYEDLCFFTLVALVPSALLLAWGHGAPGRDRWTRLEKVGVPVNLLLTLTLLVFVWRGAAEPMAQRQEASVVAAPPAVPLAIPATTQETIVMPAARATVLAFAFTNRSGNNTALWEQHAIPLALEIDMEQDPRITIHALVSGGLGEQIRQAGYDSGVGIPLALMREIAQDTEFSHFIAGSFSSDGKGHKIEVTLHESNQGKAIATHAVENSDLLAAVDAIGVQLKHSLGLSPEEIAAEIDLPVAEQATASLPALRWPPLWDLRTATGRSDWALLRPHRRKPEGRRVLSVVLEGGPDTN